MKIRSDSPFAKLTEEQKMWILDYAEVATIEQVTNDLLLNYDIDTSDSAVQRFLVRLRTEKAVEDAKAQRFGGIGGAREEIEFAGCGPGVGAAEVGGCGGECGRRRDGEVGGGGEGVG